MISADPSPTGSAPQRVRVIYPSADTPLAGTRGEVRELVVRGLEQYGDIFHDTHELADAVAGDVATALALRQAQHVPVPALLATPEAMRFGRFLRSQPPERRWLLRDVKPHPIVGLLASPGGVGKSYLLYQMLVCVATGHPCLGIEMGEPGGVLYLAAEDDDAELHRRGLVLHDWYSHLTTWRALKALTGVDPDEAIAERVHVLSRVGVDNMLTVRSSESAEVRQTAMVERLIETARRIPDLRLIVLDPVSRFRGGRANEEEDATRFVETLEHVRSETGANVLASVHVRKASMRDDEAGQEQVRGSTGLVDAVRWVATLRKLRREQAKSYGLRDEEADRYLRLEIPKNNYAAPFPGLWLRREGGGVLVPTDLIELPESKAAEKAGGRYDHVVERLHTLLRTNGPKTRRAIRPFCGQSGILGASDQTVRSIIERAVAAGDLSERDGLLDLPEAVL